MQLFVPLLKIALHKSLPHPSDDDALKSLRFSFMSTGEAITMNDDISSEAMALISSLIVQCTTNESI